jgi:hypothetical protein
MSEIEKAKSAFFKKGGKITLLVNEEEIELVPGEPPKKKKVNPDHCGKGKKKGRNYPEDYFG